MVSAEGQARWGVIFSNGPTYHRWTEAPALPSPNSPEITSL